MSFGKSFERELEKNTGKWGSNVIFGTARWLNPNSESNGSYILNGTDLPVFFTDDITSMTAIEQIELIKNTEKVI